MRARPRWTGCPRSRSAASPSRPLQRPRSGPIIVSTSSIRPGTWTSPSRWSAACACSTVRSSCSTAWPAWSPSPRRSGARPTDTACPGSASSTSSTAPAPTSGAASTSIKDRLGANAVPVQIPIGQEDTFKGVIDLVEMKAIYYRDDLGKQIDVIDIPRRAAGRGAEAPHHAHRGRRRDGRRADPEVPRGRGADGRGDQARPACRHPEHPHHPGAHRLGAQEQGHPADAGRGHRIPALAPRRAAADRHRPAHRRGAAARGRATTRRSRHWPSRSRRTRSWASWPSSGSTPARSRPARTCSTPPRARRSASAAWSRCTPTTARRSTRSTRATSPPPSASRTPSRVTR